MCHPVEQTILKQRIDIRRISDIIIKKAIMTKKKKIIISVSVTAGGLILLATLAAIIIFAVLPMTVLRENSKADAREIAVKQFGVDSVRAVCFGTSGSCLTEQNTPNYPIYVLGEKAGEEIFIIVPQLKGYPAYKTDWPFAKTLREMTDVINGFAGSDICDINNLQNLEIIDNEYHANYYLKGRNEFPLDVNVLVYCNGYFIYQSRNEFDVFYYGNI